MGFGGGAVDKDLFCKALGLVGSRKVLRAGNDGVGKPYALMVDDLNDGSETT